MRHFAAELEQDGFVVRYVRLDEPGNTGSLAGEVRRAITDLAPEAVIATEPGEWRVETAMRAWCDGLNVPLSIRPDTSFLCSREQFMAWAADRRSLLMESFYRIMRKQLGLLMDVDGEPVGGAWNFDAENRNPLPRDASPPEPLWIEPDAITREVLTLVAQRFGSHFGKLEPFGFAVTRADALRVLDRFIEERLPFFGDYQDAMRQALPVAGRLSLEPASHTARFLFHAVISPYLNAGLLLPLEVCRRAEAAYEQGLVPLNAAEGFIRQIGGWREYMRGVYWLKMPDFEHANALAADHDLPGWYWTGETDLNCLAQVIGQTRDEAYAHHIQRLMVAGNFALLIGAKPEQVNEWYLVVYADAYQWVELPNVSGMILFADGGFVGSKPYAASGQYINRMSDYCQHCRFDVHKRSGPDACPFNYLYWDFLARNRAKLESNRRLAMPYRTLDKMSVERRAEIASDARRFLDSLPPYSPAP